MSNLTNSTNKKKIMVYPEIKCVYIRVSRELCYIKYHRLPSMSDVSFYADGSPCDKDELPDDTFSFTKKECLEFSSYASVIGYPGITSLRQLPSRIKKQISKSMYKVELV